jgi:hypothetical protein
MSNKEKLNVKLHMMENFKEIKEVEKPVTPTCESCGKSIVGTKWNKEYQHINIAQKPEKRFFCSRQCKLTWIFKNI